MLSHCLCVQFYAGSVFLYCGCETPYLHQVEENERYSVDEFDSVLLGQLPENGKVFWKERVGYNENSFSKLHTL